MEFRVFQLAPQPLRLKGGVPFYPIENYLVGFLLSLPEKAVGLAFEQLQFRAGNAALERFGLREVIAAR